VPFVTELSFPRGLVFFQEWLFVADGKRILRVDRKGKSEVFAAATAFPSPPNSLVDIEVDIETGTLYVLDTGEERGIIYLVPPKGKVELVADAKKSPELFGPISLTMDGQSHVLIADRGVDRLLRLNIATGATEKVADFTQPVGVSWDKFGRLFVSEHKGN